MPTTRSATKQSHIEDFTRGSGNATRPAGPPSKKRKTSSSDKPEKEELASRVKKPKTEARSTETKVSDNDSITINRSPVLQLWGAVVAQFVHPELSWSTCLSIGNAIASLCAISKGKSIGVIEPSEKEPESRSKKKSKQSQVVRVMGFPLHIEKDVATVGGKPKDLNERLLLGKFGGEEKYARAKHAMEEGLQSWREAEDELNGNAFHMYETFRPNVAGGQKGWGRKGELSLGEVTSALTK